MIKYLLIVQLIILSLIPKNLGAQTQEKFSLEDCINYAWENSTAISRANNNLKAEQAYLEQSKAARNPNLFFNGNQSLRSSSSYVEDEDNYNRSNAYDLSLSLSSEMTLYNGAKLKNTILQGKTNLKASETDIKTQKEAISLSVLSSYINTLLSDENVKNYEVQLASTEKELELAKAREEAGIISTADYYTIKSQYAADKASYIGAQNTFKLNLVTLMQLMNMPINDDFKIQIPPIDSLINKLSNTNAEQVYNIALDLQPSIKSAELDLESTQINIEIAKADARPKLSLSGSLGTGYNSQLSNSNMSDQISNKVNPYLGLSLSVPIYQRKKVKTNVAIAQLETDNRTLELTDLKNDLRKYIEQACIDAQTTHSNYRALQEQYEAQLSTFQLSEEMFSQGLMNSVDFLSSKNNLTTAENKVTEAKYEVLLQNKIIDYYLGKTLLF